LNATYELRFVMDYCPHSEQYQNVSVKFVQVPILGTLKRDYKKFPIGCDNEDCPHLGTFDCKIWDRAVI